MLQWLLLPVVAAFLAAVVSAQECATALRGTILVPKLGGAFCMRPALSLQSLGVVGRHLRCYDTEWYCLVCAGHANILQFSAELNELCCNGGGHRRALQVSARVGAICVRAGMRARARKRVAVALVDC